MRRLLLTISAAALVLVACGDDDTSTDEEAGAVIEGVVVEDGQDNGHVDDPTYDAAPPSGGDHIEVWLDCGVYVQPVPAGNAVHSLEHGAVWFAYDPESSADDIDRLEALASINPDKIIVSPYPGIEHPVVAVAWERRLEVDSAADPRLAAFAEAFVDGSQAPEPGVTCAGGVG